MKGDLEQKLKEIFKASIDDKNKRKILKKRREKQNKEKRIPDTVKRISKKIYKKYKTKARINKKRNNRSQEGDLQKSQNEEEEEIIFKNLFFSEDKNQQMLNNFNFNNTDSYPRFPVDPSFIEQESPFRPSPDTDYSLSDININFSFKHQKESQKNHMAKNINQEPLTNDCQLILPSFLNYLEKNPQFYPSQNNIGIQNAQNLIRNNISQLNFEPYSTRYESYQREEINDKIFKCTMSKEDCKMENPICCICQEEIKSGEETSKIPCKHLFHSNCCKSWVDINPTCPICRSNITIEKNN